ncbi:HAD family hydrolase [Millisia brevis]|uniref:HAD family hydrolase n=1 Tax=Millisia brevis TaxID=264148 RepID=UPI0008347ECB|nr:HAD family hydrolase [Millisia brevis]
MKSNNVVQLLLLDFDGVIADSVEECTALSYWAGPEQPPVDIRTAFAEIPEDFRSRFAELRPFSRTLDDFAVTQLARKTEPVTTQATFDRLKAAIDSDDIERFAASARRLRDHWRETNRREWLDTHTVFPGIPELLARYSGRVFVITAKDATSSLEILRHFDLSRHVAGVMGDVSDKGLAARCLAIGGGLPLDAALFVDDNITNVARVSAAGVPSRWATWGWVSPEHAGRAAELELFSLDLRELAHI